MTIQSGVLNLVISRASIVAKDPQKKKKHSRLNAQLQPSIKELILMSPALNK
jgi:hypothetical protein